MTDLHHLLGGSGPLAEALPGFRPRREQLEMAQAVAAAIAAREHLIVEAGTGTGKTFAYLVPALLSGRHVIVSTGTRALQDQLYHRDLPLLAQVLGRPVRVALLKGRANYLCRHRLRLALMTPDLPGTAGRRGGVLARIERWSLLTRAGDIAELEGVAENDPAWALATSTRDNCLGQDCPALRECHVVQARREAQAADLVIVNHHLLLADLALREEALGELLPSTDAVVVDEAHQFPEIAAQFFGMGIAARQLLALARDALAELTRAGLLDASSRALIEAVEAGVGAVQRSLAGFGGAPRAAGDTGDTGDPAGRSGAARPVPGARIEWPDLPDAFHEAAQALMEALDALGAHLDEPELEAAGVRQCARRARDAGARLRALLGTDAAVGVRWVDCTARTFGLQFVPFEVAERLRTHVRARPCAWVYTSATLAVGDSFVHFASRVGASDARTLRIPSPFDYERNARLYLPRGMPDPAERGYTAAVIDAALPLVRAAGGRTFLLFTSHRALGEGAALLRQRLGRTDAFVLLVQGEAPRDALLRRFRETGNAVLLGTGSFWEGVDVRGPALSLVVIDRLPFASPDDPVLKARLAGLRRDGRNAFVDHQLPQAVLALKQGVGRLIRDPDDSGIVLLADPRVRTKGYGRTFVASLPPMRLTQDLDEAVRFLRERLGPLAPLPVA